MNYDCNPCDDCQINYAAVQSLKRELVEALKKDHWELMEEAVIGGWERHEQYGPCNNCKLITRAEEKP